MANIIVIEDSLPVLKLLTTICTQDGHDVLAYDNGEAGLAAIAELTPEVALVDRRLGRSDGLDLVQKVREASPHTRCVMVTGCTETRDIVTAMRRGAYGYVTKPFESYEIQEAIREALEAPPEAPAVRQKLVIMYASKQAAVA